LLEYLEWCEDLDLLPILVVWAGLSLTYPKSQAIHVDAVLPFIKEALDEIEVIPNLLCGAHMLIWPASIFAVQLQASMGHSAKSMDIRTLSRSNMSRLGTKIFFGTEGLPIQRGSWHFTMRSTQNTRILR
jgi:hypothetical protein